jgi:hypothetical protein
MSDEERNTLVQAEIERLCGADDAALERMNEASARKRIAWFGGNRDSFSFLSGDPLDSAYRLLLARFGIPPEEAPVVRKTEREIVFHSKNFCPTLEACQLLGLDTRHVCRLLNEESTNRLIRCVDPRLRFSRNYEKLRPYAPYCEEMISIED